MWIINGSVAFLYIVISFVGFRQFVRGRKSEQVHRRRRYSALARPGQKLRWVDFYASADPVPNGPIFDQDPSWMQSFQVWNRSSWFTDHSSYRKNLDGFVAPLSLLFASTSSPALATALGAMTQSLPEAGRRRAWRCSLLKWGRVVVGGSVVFAAANYWTPLRSGGQAVIEDTPGWVRDVFSGLGKVFPSPPGMIPADAIVAVLMIIALLYASEVAVRVAWAGLEKHDLRRFYRGDECDFGGDALILYSGVVGGLVIASWVLILQSLGAVKFNTYDLPTFLIVAFMTPVVLAVLGRLDGSDFEADEEIPIGERNRERRRARKAIEALEAALISFVPALVLLGVGLYLLVNYPLWSPWVGYPVALCFFAAWFGILMGSAALQTRMEPTFARWGRLWIARTVRSRGGRDAVPGNEKATVSRTDSVGSGEIAGEA